MTDGGKGETMLSRGTLRFYFSTRRSLCLIPAPDEATCTISTKAQTRRQRRAKAILLYHTTPQRYSNGL